MDRMIRRNHLAVLACLAAGLAACDDGVGPTGAPSDVAVRVYVDNDASASFTTGDLGVSGVRIVLTENTTRDTYEATTTSEGVASFADVDPGSYTASVATPDALPAGAEFAARSTMTIRTPFQGAQIAEEIRLVFQPAGIEGVVFRDDDASGTVNAGDTPGAGFEVRLYRGTAATGTPIDTATTSAGGAFAFDLLAPGDYTIEVVPPTPAVEIVGGTSYTVSLAAGEDRTVALQFTGTLLSSIAEAIAQPTGTTVVFEGVVTVPQGAFRTDNAYVQDPSGGVQVFGIPAELGLAAGDSVRVVGVRGEFNGQPQINNPVVTEIGTGTVPAPRVVTGAQVNARTFEGQLVTVPGATVTAVSGSATSTAYNVTLSDAAGTSFVLRVSGSGVGIPQTFFTVGQKLNVTGVLGSFRGTAQLLPRSAADVSAVAAPTPIATVRAQEAGSAALATGVVTARFGSSIYFQDATGGIMVFLGSGNTTVYAPGDSITVEGTVGAFNGEVQLTSPTVTRLKTDAAIPAPRLITGAELVAKTYEGQLARVENVTVTAAPTSGTSGNVTATAADGTTIVIRIDSNSGIPVTTFTVGSRYNVTGVLGQFRGTAQLKPRSTADVAAL